MTEPSAELVAWLRVVAADARKRMSAGGVPPEWHAEHLPAIEVLILENRQHVH
jgi:hypothetical protein